VVQRPGVACTELRPESLAVLFEQVQDQVMEPVVGGAWPRCAWFISLAAIGATDPVRLVHSGSFMESPAHSDDWGPQGS
jgi:hypothetical protein